MKRYLFAGFAILLLCSACATKTGFIYQHPEYSQTGSGEMVISLDAVKDSRPEPKTIDAIYETDPMLEIHKVVHNELMSTGHFKTVLVKNDLVNTDSGNEGVDLVASFELLELDYVIPKYDEIQRNSFVIGFLGGVVGGLIYLATDTEVAGSAEMLCVLTDARSGEEIINKTYRSDYQSTASKGKCEAPATKAVVIGESIQMMMNEFKADLKSQMDARQKLTMIQDEAQKANSPEPANK